MDWKLMDDTGNPENANAGNGGDLVKHTVYLATLRFLFLHMSLGNRDCACENATRVEASIASPLRAADCFHAFTQMPRRIVRSCFKVPSGTSSPQSAAGRPGWRRSSGTAGQHSSMPLL